MNDADEPTPEARVAATALMVLQICVLGPLSALCTLASYLLCCVCIDHNRLGEVST